MYYKDVKMGVNIRFIKDSSTKHINYNVVAFYLQYTKFFLSKK